MSYDTTLKDINGNKIYPRTFLRNIYSSDGLRNGEELFPEKYLQLVSIVDGILTFTNSDGSTIVYEAGVDYEVYASEQEAMNASLANPNKLCLY